MSAGSSEPKMECTPSELCHTGSYWDYWCYLRDRLFSLANVYTFRQKFERGYCVRTLFHGECLLTKIQDKITFDNKYYQWKNKLQIVDSIVVMGVKLMHRSIPHLKISIHSTGPSHEFQYIKIKYLFVNSRNNLDRLCLPNDVVAFTGSVADPRRSVSSTRPRKKTHYAKLYTNNHRIIMDL